MLTSNLGVLLALFGKRVAIADLDLGASNLHTFIEQKDMGIGLGGFLDKSVDRLEETLVPTRIPHLDFLNSVNCNIDIANLYAAQKEKIIRALRGLPYDYVLMDLGAGTHFNTLDFFLTSRRGFFIVTPEPTSIENAFNFIKAIYSRILKQLLKQPMFQEIRSAMGLGNAHPSRPFSTIKAILDQDARVGELLRMELEAYQFCFVINQLRHRDDPKLGLKIQKICNKYFYADFKFLGNIRHDAAIHEAVLMQKIFITQKQPSHGARDILSVARSLSRL